jgi:hypothetical protein
VRKVELARGPEQINALAQHSAPVETLEKEFDPMLLVYLPFLLLLVSTAFAMLSALGRAPLWIAVLLLCIAALTSALPVSAVTSR